MACTFYEFKSSLLSGDYWCRKKDCRVDNETYYKYCRNYNYNECPIYKYTEPSGCFITTIVCNILKIEDNNQVLNNLRYIRDNILQNDEKYSNILKDYDIIGPILADKITEDKNPTIIAKGLYEKALKPISNLIEKKHYSEAVEKYYLMTLMLINYYNLTHTYNNIKDNNYNNIDFNKIKKGHGLRRVKINY